MTVYRAERRKGEKGTTTKNTPIRREGVGDKCGCTGKGIGGGGGGQTDRRGKSKSVD